MAVTGVVTVAYLVGDEVVRAGAARDVLYWVVLALLVVAGIQSFRHRRQTRQPRWVARLGTADAGFSFKLGMLLLGVFPSDLLTSLAVGTDLVAGGQPWWHALPFVGLTVLLLSVPALLVLSLGDRAQNVLSRVRDWLTEHAWIVNEVVLGFFIILTMNNLIG